MNDNRKPTTDKTDNGRLKAGGKRVTRQQLQNLLANPGYSADMRKGELKEALTELEQQGRDLSDEDRELAEAIKRILDAHQSGKPISDDVL